MLCLTALAACGTVTGNQPDPRACRQTYEFGNTGCVDIAGQVVGSAGQPLAGMVVGPGMMSTPVGLNAVYDETDANGRFEIRLTRFAGEPPRAGPDTLSLYVRALDPRSAGLDVPATVRESVLVRVTLAPVGSVPRTTSVVIRLPMP